MSHLSPERLAALADDDPTPAELAHLSACPACAAEREAHRALVALASMERASIGLPLTRWESLAPALDAEGLMAGHGAGAGRAARTPPGRFWLRAAAAVLFVAGGTLFGRYTAGATLLPGLPAAPAAATSAAAAGDTAVPATFASVDAARAARSHAQILYQNATTYLAQNDSAATGSESPSAMRTRLAALDRVSHAMRDALADAPYDPVINDYYLTTLGQREATLRQLNTALPAGMRVNSF
ncbi:MAG: hypothetical protein KGN74_00905 [Gemmatimonadota bacterium]|nr:hypothetical protein [Gemmatimonadota bacterium]